MLTGGFGGRRCGRGCFGNDHFGLRDRRLDDGRGLDDGSLDRSGSFGNRRFDNGRFSDHVLVDVDALLGNGFLCDGLFCDCLLGGLVVTGVVVGLFCSCLLCRGLLRDGLLFGLRLFGLFVTDETVALGTTTYTVGLCLDDRRRMALHIDTHDETEIDGLFVCEAELFGELVDAHVLWQVDFSLSLPIR